MNYILDTNILLLYLRKNNISKVIDAKYQPLDISNTAIISTVSVGEIQSIGIQNNWGNKKIQLLNFLLGKFLIAGIKVDSIINKYAEIDAYSQNKLPSKTLKMTARNMGKNDLWIAATASILGATLLTTDKDFSHLHHQFINLELIDIEKLK